jgi:hypothetical protein
MRCLNCGLPLAPGNNLSNCPRCGMPLNALQGATRQQAGWGNMGGAPEQNSWGQAGVPGGYSPFPQQGYSQPSGPPGMGEFNRGQIGERQPFTPRRPVPPPKSRSNPRSIFVVAGLCIIVAGLILGLVAVLAFSGNGAPTPNTASTGAQTPAASGSTPQTATSPTAGASPTSSASPSATGTPYPGQQYIDGAQMVASLPTGSQQPQPTTTFKVGSNMYVIFQLHPPSTGGAVCSYWYLNGNPNPVTTYQQAVKASSRSSYTYAIYGSPGQAYVELYWASDKTCADKMLAQHVDFTVTP